MKIPRYDFDRQTRVIVALILISSVFLFGGVPGIFAHGGEDHGDTQSQIVATNKGISRSARLGEVEIAVKHPVLDPDVAANGLLFITKYETNEAVDKAEPTVEIENAGGTVTQVAVTRSEIPGTFTLKLPPMPEGNYTMRVKVMYSGETDTLTLSGVNVSHAEPGADGSSSISWFRSILLVFTGIFVLVLFAGLFYFVWRTADTGDGSREPVSV